MCKQPALHLHRRPHCWRSTAKALVPPYRTAPRTSAPARPRRAAPAPARRPPVGVQLTGRRGLGRHARGAGRGRRRTGGAPDAADQAAGPARGGRGPGRRAVRERDRAVPHLLAALLLGAQRRGHEVVRLSHGSRPAPRAARAVDPPGELRRASGPGGGRRSAAAARRRSPLPGCLLAPLWPFRRPAAARRYRAMPCQHQVTSDHRPSPGTPPRHEDARLSAQVPCRGRHRTPASGQEPPVLLTAPPPQVAKDLPRPTELGLLHVGGTAK